MAITVTWTDGEMQTITGAVAAGDEPKLGIDVAARIVDATPPIAGAEWAITLPDFQTGQRLKAWCDARRERATEQEPNDTWTRIVARVNEVVQPFAPAKDDEAHVTDQDRSRPLSTSPGTWPSGEETRLTWRSMPRRSVRTLPGVGVKVASSIVVALGVTVSLWFLLRQWRR